MREAELAMMRRLGADEDSILITQQQPCEHVSKARTIEEALVLIQRDVYSGFLKLHGGQHRNTIS